MTRTLSRRARYGRWAVGASAALVLGVGALTAAGPVADPAGAAPNPIRGGESTATITLDAADGSYRVHSTESAELLDDHYQLTFGLAMHDGFRAPDDDQPGPPPYLRPEYVVDATTFDRAPGPTDFTREGHLLTLEVGGEVSEGEHEGEFRYSVSGAALPTDDGYEVYVRAGDLPSGEHLVIDGSALDDAKITEVRCQYRPIPTPCGAPIDADRWHPGGDSPEVIVIAVDGPTDSLVPPVLDRD